MRQHLMKASDCTAMASSTSWSVISESTLMITQLKAVVILEKFLMESLVGLSSLVTDV